MRVVGASPHRFNSRMLLLHRFNARMLLLHRFNVGMLLLISRRVLGFCRSFCRLFFVVLVWYCVLCHHNKFVKSGYGSFVI